MGIGESFRTQPWPARIAGAILLLLALLLLGFTEHKDRLRAMGEDALGGFVLTGDAAKPGPASDGQLVLVAGAVQIAAPARDPQFNVGVSAPSLIRKVQVFQWHEIGARHDYELDWIDHPVDSSQFTQPNGHQNPGTFPVEGARFDSPDVRVQGFKLGPELIHAIAGVEAFKPDLRALPANMAATFQPLEDALVSSANPKSPQVGDLRVSWQKIAPDDLTVLARAHNGTLVETRDASDNALAQVQIGKRSLSDVLPDAPQRPRFAWARRVLALLLGWAGIILLLPAWRRDELLALLLAVVPLALLAAIFWSGIRVLLASALVLVAIVAGVAAVWLSRRGARVVVPAQAQAVRRDDPDSGEKD